MEVDKMRWSLLCPQDHTWHCDKEGNAHRWSINSTDAKTYPTYMQTNLAMLEINRDYADIGYYELEIREVPE
jgi:hypothetical protein